MSRRIRFLAAVLFTSLAIGAAACSSPASPLDDCGGDNGTCFNADGYQNSDN